MSGSGVPLFLEHARVALGEAFRSQSCPSGSRRDRSPLIPPPLWPRSQALPGQTTPDGVPAFKLVLVGDGGTGAWAQFEFSCPAVEFKITPPIPPATPQGRPPSSSAT